MPDDLFGPLVTGSDVERATIDTLKAWTPDYLGWAERASGRRPGSLNRPRSWVVSTGFDRWPEEQLPSVLVLSTGLAEPPTRDGSGSYHGVFALGLAVVVSAKDREETDELAKLYTAALRAVLIQHPSLGGFADGVEWVDERYDALPGDPKRRRQLASGQNVFRIGVPDVVNARLGPATPSSNPQAPPASDPTVATTDVEVEPADELAP